MVARNELMELKRSLQTLEIELQSITAMVRENRTEGVRANTLCTTASKHYAEYVVMKGDLFIHPSSVAQTVPKPSWTTPHHGKWHHDRSLRQEAKAQGGTTLNCFKITLSGELTSVQLELNLFIPGALGDLTSH